MTYHEERRLVKYSEIYTVGRGLGLPALNKTQQKKEYRRMIPPARIRSDFPSAYNFILVDDLEHLETILEEHKDKGIMAFDLETSSLDPEEGFIVGAVMSFDERTGYYVAIKHFNDKYNLGKPGLDLIYKKMLECKKVLMYNAKFDIRFMEYYGFDKENPEHHKNRISPIGYDMSDVSYYDVSVGAWLADTNIPMPSLKNSSLDFCGIKQQTFEEVSNGAVNFYYIEPEDAVFYAGGDGISTYALAGATVKYYQESGLAGKLDNGIVYPLMHFEQEKIWIDGSTIESMIKKVEDRAEYLEKEIYKDVGYVFNLNSPVQVAEAFQRKGVDTGLRTKGGAMQTGIKLLEKLDGEKFPVVGKFVEYKRLFKLISSYLTPIRKEYERRGYLRCNYMTQRAPTGRLASGKDKKNTFFSPINIQSIPKPKPQFCYVLDLGDRDLYDRNDRTVMGYKLVPVQVGEDGQTVDGKEIYGDQCLGVVESFDQDINVRKLLTPVPEGDFEGQGNDWIFLSVDFCIDPNALVELEDGSKIPLKELEGREENIKTPHGFYKAKNFRYTGKKKKCRLRLKSGREVICSPDHRFYVKTVDGEWVWKELKEIQSTDYIDEDKI